MFDDLRKEAEAKPLYEEEAKFKAASTDYSSGKSGRLLGLTSVQRFVLVFMLMMAVCIVGALALFATGKILF